MLRSFAFVITLSAALPALAGGGATRRLATAKPIELYHPTPSPKGTILMFHGYSSGPAEWKAEAEMRFKQGYDVLVAALPGHGFVDKNGREDISRLPKAEQASKYTRFADGMFKRARSRSDKVHVVGFSVGGTHALEVALANRELKAADGRPVIRSVVAVNPYLSPTSRKVAGVSIDPDRAVAIADRMTLGLLRKKVLPRHEYVFENAIRKQNAGQADVGFTKVDLGHVYAIGRFGDQVEARAKEAQRAGGLGRPAWVVISEKDPTADPATGLRVAEQIGAHKVVIPTDKHNPFSWAAIPDGPAVNSRLEVHRAIGQALAAGAD